MLNEYVIKKVCVRRAVKVITGQYQNTDIEVTLEANCHSKNIEDVSVSLLKEVDNILGQKIKEIGKNIDLKQFGITLKTKDKHGP